MTAIGHGRLSRRVRRAVAGGGAAWTSRLPSGWIEKFELGGGVVRPLRIELGGGDYPSPGYVHVDANWRSQHLEYLAEVGDLPFANGTVQELLAIHLLEHIHPEKLDATLREWRRVLVPGGVAQIHVPNARTVLPAFLDAPLEKKRTLATAIFGVTDSPDTTPARVMVLDQHKMIFDFELLKDFLLQAGFARVEDMSQVVTDRHMGPWEEGGLVKRISLIVRAHAGEA
jgi:predicted SAM-dependent methyltransferase